MDRAPRNSFEFIDVGARQGRQEWRSSWEKLIAL